MSQRSSARSVRPLVAATAAAALALLLVAQTNGSATTEAAEEARASSTIGENGPTVFAHRGASGYRPEQTLAAFELAIRMGADSLEPDLVITSDGVLVARHENWLGETTDVADRPEFADRRTTKTISGEEIEDEWFAEDFTLEELKTLRAIEPLPELRQQNTIYDGRFEVATMQEIIDLAEEAGRHGRQIGLFPETKHPTYFESIGLPLEEPLIEVIEHNGLNLPDGPLLVQSFEPTSLRKLDAALDVPVVQTMAADDAPYDTVAAGEGPTFPEMRTPEGLREVATYADGIGPQKDMVIAREDDDSLGEPTSLVSDAHAAGLAVVVYTFRNENEYLPSDLRIGDDPSDYGDAIAEYLAFYEAGIDGVWSDNPDTALIAREEFLRDR